MSRLLSRLLLISVVLSAPSLVLARPTGSSNPTYSPEAYKAAVRKLETVKASHPRITVFGQITQRAEDGSLVLFGHTMNCRINVDPGCLNPYAASGGGFQEHNMIVTDPDDAALRQFGGIQYSASHYYIGRHAGRNAFGAEVPVYVYGDPPELKNAAAVVRRLHDLAAAKGLDPATGEVAAVQKARETHQRQDARDARKASAEKFVRTGTILKCSSRGGKTFVMVKGNPSFEVLYRAEDNVDYSGVTAGTPCELTGQAFVVTAFMCDDELPCIAKLEPSGEAPLAKPASAGTAGAEERITAEARLVRCEGAHTSQSSAWPKNPRWEGDLLVSLDDRQEPTRLRYLPQNITNKLSRFTDDSAKTPCTSLCGDHAYGCNVKVTYFQIGKTLYVEQVK